jgi:hypothetical protein
MLRGALQGVLLPMQNSSFLSISLRFFSSLDRLFFRIFHSNLASFSTRLSYIAAAAAPAA